jgi:type IV secretory pathway protease TraF
MSIKSILIKATNDKKRLKRFVILSAAILSACLAFSLTLGHFFSFAFPPSLSHKLFWVDRDIRKISRGDYVSFNLSDKHTGDRTLRMIKIVVCDEGDILTVDSGKKYFCNGVYLGKAKNKALDGSLLTNFAWNGPVPPGMILPMGEHKDSYDGRYYGFIKKTAILNKAHPVF